MTTDKFKSWKKDFEGYVPRIDCGIYQVINGVVKILAERYTNECPKPDIAHIYTVLLEKKKVDPTDNFQFSIDMSFDNKGKRKMDVRTYRPQINGWAMTFFSVVNTIKKEKEENDFIASLTKQPRLICYNLH